MDYAGVVLAVGPECKSLKVGDRVVGIMKPFEYQPGTWAEQTKAPEKEVVKITLGDCIITRLVGTTSS